MPKLTLLTLRTQYDIDYTCPHCAAQWGMHMNAISGIYCPVCGKRLIVEALQRK